MRQTFNNGMNNDQRLEALASINGRIEDFKVFMNSDDLEKTKVRDDKGRFTGDTMSFYDYGLCIDYVSPGTFNNQKEGYLRYQLSYGGPSSEIRFYLNPGFDTAHQIEFVYLDWFVGIGFDVTNEDWAQWLIDYFSEIGISETEYEKAIEC